MADSARSAHPGVQAQLDRLSMLSPAGDQLGLERISALLERLGRPQDKLPPVFHVAGTNGKGSTVAFLRAALEAAGNKVHVFTSPHLVRFNERIRVAGKLIEDEPLEALLSEILDVSGGIEPSFFEVATAAAILAFSRTPADSTILEVGLGGRLDATNVIEHPVVTGIADLGLDHEHFLGNRLIDIAGEKAGIAKRGVPLVTQDYPPEIAGRIDEIAAAVGAEPIVRGVDWNAELEGDGLLYRDIAGELKLPLPSLAGSFQARNASLAVAMIRHQSALHPPESALADGLRTAKWPGRLQLLADGPLTRRLPGRKVWLDGGHNREASLLVAEEMKGLAPFDLIFALTATRRIDDVLGPLAPLVRRAHVIPVPGHAHHDPRDIAMVAQGGLGPRETYPAFTLDEAVERLANDHEGSPNVLIFGSLYVAGEVLAANDQVPD
jgi:dihydrofolate synthase/folylpolyglutamate synthase